MKTTIADDVYRQYEHDCEMRRITNDHKPENVKRRATEAAERGKALSLATYLRDNPPADLTNDHAVLGWLRAYIHAADRAFVYVELNEDIFHAAEFFGDMNTEDNYRPEDAHNSAGYLVGQAMSGGAGLILAGWINDWETKFGPLLAP